MVENKLFSKLRMFSAWNLAFPVFYFHISPDSFVLLRGVYYTTPESTL